MGKGGAAIFQESVVAFFLLFDEFVNADDFADSFHFFKRGIEFAVSDVIEIGAAEDKGGLLDITDVAAQIP